MKRKLLKKILCFAICGSMVVGLFSEPFFKVFAVSDETQAEIDQAEDEKEQLEQELEQQEQNKDNLEGEKATAEERLENLKAQYKSISSDLAALNKKKTEKEEEIRQNRIYDVEARTTIISSQVEDGKVVYQGELNLTFIYADERTSRINVKNLVEPFEFAVTSTNITVKSKIETNIEILKKDFLVMSDSNIDVKLDLNFRLNIVQESEINIIENVNETEARNKEACSIVIYYTKIGDTLWKIAKKFGSTIDEIVRVNNIQNPDVIMPGEQLFIPR